MASISNQDIEEGRRMNTTVIDNEDYLVMIWAETSAPLLALEAVQALGMIHKLQENLWMARVAFNKAKIVREGIAMGEFKMVVIRYTSESSYFSHDHQDQLLGRKVTG
jgi:hypothetical protein